MTILPALYKLDSKGRTRCWAIEYHDGAFRTREGLVGGATSVTDWTQCVTMNAGRANERTPAQQAEAEAHAKWQKKKDTGYAESAEASGAQHVEPMLAFPHVELDGRGGVKKDRMKGVVWPCLAQPKLDGVRCLVYLKDGKPYAQTRTGKPITSVPHVLRACAPVLAKHPDMVLDGELYNHDLRDDFNGIVSLVRKMKPTVAEDYQSERIVQYHIYDCILAGAHYKARDLYLVSALRDCAPCLIYVAPSPLESVERMDLFEEMCVGMGFEGIMLRNPLALYQGRRTVDLLKVKRFTDAEFPIVRIEEGRGNRKGLASRVWVRLSDGQECAAGVMGTDAYTADLFTHRAHYTGKPATIKFQGFTPDGMLRFAKMKEIRIND